MNSNAQPTYFIDEDDMAALVTGKNFDKLLSSFDDHEFIERIKGYIRIFCSIANDEDIIKNIKLYYDSTSQIMVYLYESLGLFQPQVTSIFFSKFWVHYLNVIDYIYINIWKNSSYLDRFWGQIDHFLSPQLDKLKEFHRNAIIRKFLLLDTFKEYKEKKKLMKDAWEEIYKEIGSKINEGLDEIEGQKFLKKEKLGILNLMELTLTTLNEAHKKSNDPNNNNNEVFRNSVYLGRFDKKDYPGLPHTVIVGEDGGWYILMNSLTIDEVNMIINEGDATKNYQDYLKNTKKISQHPNKENQKKLLIGKGTCGRLRLAIVLITTETAKIGESALIAGEIICIKKSSDKKSNNLYNITLSVWNDYVSEIVGKNIQSPTIYDMCIVYSPPPIVHLDHFKAYAMQEFVPFADGNIFIENEALKVWSHQKIYLVDIFTEVLQLMKKGIAMTDLKPGNTIYDSINKVGKLIDLAGVVRKKNFEELKICKKKYISEFTFDYTAPEVKEAVLHNENKDFPVDLTKALSFTMGTIINVIAIKPRLNTQINEEFPDFNKLKSLSERLTNKNFEERLDFETALEELKHIGPDNIEKKEDFSLFINSLREILRDKPDYLGLKRDINEIMKTLIDVKVVNRNPDENPSLTKENLNKVLDDFISKQTTSESVFLLLGNAGTGKSTILQKKFVDLINKWKPDDPIPFYMNLATTIHLLPKWQTINQLIFNNDDKKYIPFTQFSGVIKYPIILILDSFDESRRKSNLVKKFLKDLGNNPKNKIIISCRTDYIKPGNEEMWFHGGKDSKFVKKYIAPLDSDFQLITHLDNFLKTYTDIKMTDREYLHKIEISNLKESMNTSYMVYLILMVLPEFEEGVRISPFEIYEKYTKKRVENESKKLPDYRKKDIIEIIQEFNFPNQDFLKFLDYLAEILASSLHSLGLSMIDKKILEKIPVFEKIISSSNKDLLSDLAGCLDLKKERKNLGKENDDLMIGFPHDTIKNFYLTKAIFNEIDKGEGKILSENLIVDDITLMKFLSESLKNLPSKIENLKMLVLKTKTDKNKKVAVAAANAISILCASNVSFAQEDLTDIKISNANLRDGVFNGCDFTNADLSYVNMTNCKLNDTLFVKTNLKSVELGIEPDFHLYDEVKSIDIASDGQHIVTGNKNKNDESISIYGFLNRKEPLKITKGITAEVSCVLFSEDLSIIVSACSKSIRVSSSSDGKKIKNFEDTFEITSLAISQDKTVIASGSEENAIKIWNNTMEGSSTKYELKLTGHQGYISSLVFSTTSFSSKNNNPNQPFLLLSGSNDKKIILWDLSEAKIFKKFEGHTDCINSIIFSKIKQETFLSTSKDGLIKLWDINNKEQLIRNYRGHEGSVNRACFSISEKVILSCGDDKTVKLWEKETGNILKTLEGHDYPVKFVTFCYETDSIVSFADDGKIKYWKKGNNIMVKGFSGQKKYMNCIAISQDETLIAGASADPEIKIFEKNSTNLFRVLKGHEDTVSSVAFSSKKIDDSLILASASSDKTVKIWCIDKGICLKTYTHEGMVNTVAFSIDGSILASGSDDKTIRIWDPCEKTLHAKRILEEDSFKQILAVCFSFDGVFFACGGNDNMVRIWNPKTWVEEKTFTETLKIISIKFSKDSKKIISTMQSKCSIWDIYSGSKIHELKDKFWFSCVLFSNNEKFIFSCVDVFIKVWTEDINFIEDPAVNTLNISQNLSHKLLTVLNGHNNLITSLVESKDNQSLFSCGLDKTIRIWNKFPKEIQKGLKLNPEETHFVEIDGPTISFIDLKTGSLTSRLQDPDGNILCISFSSEKKQNRDRLFVTGGTDKTVKLWSDGIHSTKGKLIRVYGGLNENVLIGHKTPVNSVCFSIDEKEIISGSFDGEIIIWNKVTYQVVFTLQGHKNAVLCLSPSQDGQYLLSGSADKTVKLWDKNAAILIKTYFWDKPVEYVEFSSNNEKQIIGRNHSNIIIWEKILGKVIQNFSGAQGIKEYLKTYGKNEYHYVNSAIISPDETPLSCNQMIIKNCQNVSEKTKEIFIQRKAIDLLSNMVLKKI